MAKPAPRKRIRDPHRADKIIVAAAELFATHGFHTVSLGDIGKKAGIVGSGVYRHFDGKVAVLAALLDNSLSDLMDSAQRVLESNASPSEQLEGLIETQIDFCFKHRLAVQLYRTELTALDAEQSHRLKQIQRQYNQYWYDLLLKVRPELSKEGARILVHSAIGAIQSVVTFDSPLDPQEQSVMLRGAAQRCLS